MFKNTFTSSSSNPFSSENSFVTSIYNKTLTKPQQRLNYNQQKSNRPNFRFENDSQRKYQTNIFDNKQQNPFQKYSNLQDLVREGITERHQYQREKRRQQYSNKNNYQTKNYLEFSSHEDSSYNKYYSNQPYNSFSDSYIPNNYTSKKYQQVIPQYVSYIVSASRIPSGYSSSYTPLVPEQTQKYEPLIKDKQCFKDSNSYIKPVVTNPNEQDSSQFNFNEQSRASSIQNYFPKEQNPIKMQIYQSHKSQQQSSKQQHKFYEKIKNTNIEQQPNLSQQTFKPEQQHNNIPTQPLSKNIIKKQYLIPLDLKQSLSFRINTHNPFEQFNKNTQNINFQNSLQSYPQSLYPQSLQLNNITFYYKQLKYKPKNKNN